MSSNRRILESMLSSDNNTTRNNPHSNHSNPVRARLSKLIEQRNAQQNDSLPFTMTTASSDSTIYQFASDAEENLDMLKSRDLLTDLDMQQVGSNFCKELGDELYFNSECYPYFSSAYGRDDDPKLHLSTLLAMYGCSPNATLSDAQRATIDDYCKYNEFRDSSGQIIIPVLTTVLLIFCLATLGSIYYLRRTDSVARRDNSAIAGATAAASQDPLTRPLLASHQSNAADESHNQDAPPRSGMTL